MQNTWLMVFVALPGIEPGSGASETLILSIVLQSLSLINNVVKIVFSFYLIVFCGLVRN